MGMFSKILAVDPSLTQTGWALFEVGNTTVKSYGVIKGGSPKTPLTSRLANIQDCVSKLFMELSLNTNDYLVCEGPAPISLNPSSSIKVEQVRGIFETLGRVNGLNVLGRLNPRTVQSELLGVRGKQIPRKEVKILARSVVSKIFPDLFKEYNLIEQDIVDAMLIGILAQARISYALKSKQDPKISFEFVGLKNNFGRSGGRGLRWDR
jgi:Holliday junction resolvasome RuvABC endonuclease subunit